MKQQQSQKMQGQRLQYQMLANRQETKLLQQIAGSRINLYLGSGVVKAEKGLNTSSIGKIKLVEFANNKWRYAGNLSCDCLLISAGWSPVIHLASHQGYPINWNEENACFLSSGDNKSIFLIGSARGIWTKAGCIQSAKEIFQVFAIVSQFSPIR